MAKARVFISLLPDDPELPGAHREAMREFADVVQHPGPERCTDAEKAEALQEAEAIIVGRSGGGLTPELIDHASKLKYVGVVGGSVKMAAPNYVLEKGLTLFNAGWAMADSVAEFTLAMMLCGQRDIPHMIDVMRDRGWGRARNPFDLARKTVGLVGFGGIARRVNELLGPFTCEVLAFDPYVPEESIIAGGATPTSLRDLLTRSDIVSIHAGLSDETVGMIDAEAYSWMKDGALLVNTARAGILDEQATIDVLKSGRIRAALNVFWKEPLAADHPLRGLDNVILTPHGGGLTADRQERQGKSIVEDLRLCLSGKAPKHGLDEVMLSRMT